MKTLGLHPPRGPSAWIREFFSRREPFSVGFPKYRVANGL
jgi:hypothetical protein